jgi:hypothetical protein
MHMIKLKQIVGRISKHERLLQWTNLRHLILNT